MCKIVGAGFGRSAMMSTDMWADGSNEQGWFSRERVLFIVLAIATFLALYLCYQIVAPFIPAVAIAAAVAIATKRAHNRLRARLGNNAAAGVAVVLVACLIFVPLTLLITYIV